MEPFAFTAVTIMRRKQLSETPFFHFPCLFQLQPAVLFVGLWGEEEEGNHEGEFPGFRRSCCMDWL